ncbi:unnamed protein product [Camellia sinensis]
MASSMPKQLGELLQEKQEPFILELYLFEKGYVRNNFNSETSFHCCSGNPSRFLKRSACWGDLSKRKKAIPSCSKNVKLLFNKIVSISNHKLRNSVSGERKSSVGETSRSNQQTAESDRFSSAGSTTVYNSCSEIDIEDGPNSLQTDGIAFKLGNVPQEKEVEILSRNGKMLVKLVPHKVNRLLQIESFNGDAGKTINKELSPVSVLEKITSNEDSPVHDNRNQNAKIPFSKFIVQTSRDEPSCTSGLTASQLLSRSDPSSQYLETKRVLQQSKQLLFDFVRGMVETHAWKARARQCFLEFPGPEELGKLLCEDMRNWSKLSGNESNTTQLMNSEFAASAAEWSEFGPQVKEIGSEIGDAILEDIINNEIVVDMIELVT